MTKKRIAYFIVYAILFALLAAAVTAFIIALSAGRNGIDLNKYYSFNYKRRLLVVINVLLILIFSVFLFSLLKSRKISKKHFACLLAVFCVAVFGVSTFLLERYDLNSNEVFVGDRDGKEYIVIQTLKTHYDEFSRVYRFDYFEYEKRGSTYKLTETPLYYYSTNDFFPAINPYFIPDEDEIGSLFVYEGLDMIRSEVNTETLEVSDTESIDW